MLCQSSFLPEPEEQLNADMESRKRDGSLGRVTSHRERKQESEGNKQEVAIGLIH